MCLAYTLSLELQYINLKINTKVICDDFFFFFFLVRRFVMIIIVVNCQQMLYSGIHTLVMGILKFYAYLVQRRGGR